MTGKSKKRSALEETIKNAILEMLKEGTNGDLFKTNESIIESQHDVVKHGLRPSTVSRFSPKSAFIPYCMDSELPSDASFTTHYDDITCKNCQSEIIYRVNGAVNRADDRDELDKLLSSVELPDLDLVNPPSWLGG